MPPFRPYPRLLRLGRIALLSGLPFFAAGATAQTVLRLNELGPQDGPSAVALALFKDEVEAATHGAVHIELHAAASLGNPSTTLEAAMTGELDLFSGDMRFMLPLMIDEVTGLELPFLIPDYAAAQHYLASPLFNEARGKVLDIRHIRFLQTDAFRGPQRMMAVTRPVNSVDDLRGLRLAVFSAPSKPSTQLWQALGVTVTDIDWPDARASLEQHRIDGVVVPDLASLLAVYLPATVRYVGPVADHPQVWQIAISEGVWQRLDPQQRFVLGQAATDAATRYNRATQEASERESAALGADGSVQAITIDPLAARDRLRATYAELIANGAMTTRVKQTAEAAIAQAGEIVALLPAGAGREFQDCPHCPVMMVVPRSAPMRSAYTTWTATSSNGCRTATSTRKRERPAMPS